MINTSSMYGNLQEEEDPFMQIQKLRALKSAKYGPNKTKETIKSESQTEPIQSEQVVSNPEPEGSTVELESVDNTTPVQEKTITAEEIQIPEVDENYPVNALQVMFDMQESLQNMLGKKRGTLTPDSKENLFIKSGMSIYHLGSVVTELFELDEQLQKDNYKITDLSRFELTDAVHFLMNTLLYINLKPKNSLEWYYDKAIEDYKTGTVGETSIKYLIGDYIIAFGQIMQQLPYKAWKTYNSFEPKVSYTELYKMVDNLMIKFIKLYISLDMKPEDIWKFYYEKNRENFARQKVGGRYEK